MIHTPFYVHVQRFTAILHLVRLCVCAYAIVAVNVSCWSTAVVASLNGTRLPAVANSKVMPLTESNQRCVCVCANHVGLHHPSRITIRENTEIFFVFLIIFHLT